MFYQSFIDSLIDKGNQRKTNYIFKPKMLAGKSFRTFAFKKTGTETILETIALPEHKKGEKNVKTIFQTKQGEGN